MLKLNKTLEPSWVQETLCVYPFLVYRKSFSLLGLPGISKSRFEWLRCTILDAWGWCTGTTQRDGMGREEGSGWGTHVYLWRIHFDIWQN